MYLIYTDETGTNIGQDSSRFLLYGGLVVHETKLNTLELQLENIVAEFLGIENLMEVELHTTDIFNYLLSGKEPDKPAKKKLFEPMKLTIESKTLVDFANFIEELIHFLNKINIPFKVSLIDKKNALHKKHHISPDVSMNAYSFKIFLNLIDKFLASENEMGLLIADSFDGQLSKTIKNKSVLEKIQDVNLKGQKELIYLRILYESLDWKVKPSSLSVRELDSIAPMRYSFEGKNMFLLDNINYTSSQDSIINQITDALLFIIRKAFEVVSFEGELIESQKKLKIFYDTIKFSLNEMHKRGNLEISIIYQYDEKIDYGEIRDSNDVIEDYLREINRELSLSEEATAV